MKIVEGVTVTGFRRRTARITHVVTDQGEVACEIAVNAGGLWARQVGEMAGIELPVTVLEHQYLVTEKSPLIPDKLPTLRDPDLNFYLKSEPGALAIGGWEEGTVAVNGRGKLPMDFGQELFAENLDRLAVIAGPAAERIPVLNEVGIRTVINGPIPVSADGEPVIGIADGIDNLFIACGFTAGIAASARSRPCGRELDREWRSRHGSGRICAEPFCGPAASTLTSCVRRRCGPMRLIMRFQAQNRKKRRWRIREKAGYTVGEFMRMSSA